MPGDIGLGIRTLFNSLVAGITKGHCLFSVQQDVSFCDKRKEPIVLSKAEGRIKGPEQKRSFVSKNASPSRFIDNL